MKKVLAWAQKVVDSAMGKVVISMAESAGESKMESILQELHDKDPAVYQLAIKAGNDFVSYLQPIAAKTESTLDDEVLADLKTIIATSATSNGITLN